MHQNLAGNGALATHLPGTMCAKYKQHQIVETRRTLPGYTQARYYHFTHPVPVIMIDSAPGNPTSGESLLLVNPFWISPSKQVVKQALFVELQFKTVHLPWYLVIAPNQLYQWHSSQSNHMTLFGTQPRKSKLNLQGFFPPNSDHGKWQHHH